STQSAAFTAVDPVSNVISRVTGGTQSFIDGLLRSDIPGANFFLLNPQGVLFGPNAQINVDGTFNVGGADFLEFD
ncbi:MAG: filamentous hemagglutinin N-terminal domain-containing protein, partial [Nitrospinaceae bacterium]|nr:filamentous hemagglutinin N-terminal domain-containing protein [Nitrospinaceae bacterium]NIX37044.1 filamentous hemagglutinin N-terminal domain-containing protein [Nitrospinaceae bacterium]